MKLNIYFRKLFNLIGTWKIIFYFFLLIFTYSLFSLQPYFILKLFTVEDTGQRIDILYLFLTLVSFLTISLINYPNNYFLQKIRRFSKEIIWEDIEQKKYLYFVDNEIGKILNLIQEISFSSRSLQYEFLQVIFRAFIMIVIYTILLSKTSLLLSGIYLITYIIFFIISYLLSKRDNKGISSVLNSTSMLNNYMVDYYKNIETILTSKSFDIENYKLNNLLMQEEISYKRVQMHIDNSHFIQQFFLTTLTFFIIFLYTFIFNNQSINVSVLLILIYSAINFTNIGQKFLGFQEHIGRIKGSLDKLKFSAIDIKINESEPFTFKKLDKNSIVNLNNIKYGFPGGFSISNINLDIKHGEKIAFIGKNGCGKSIILKLIAGFLVPQSGKILYNSLILHGQKDIKYYSQSASLFDRSIYENIIYPNEQYPIDKIMDLVYELQLSSLITNQQDLLNKKPGDFGSRFSGGEKQKIILGRAIINNAPIILFDEIDASLDTFTDSIFHKLLNTYLKNSTVICITHKENYLHCFDRIYDIENKRFLEMDNNLSKKTQSAQIINKVN